MSAATTSPRVYEVAYTAAMVQDAVRTYVMRRLVREQKGLWLGALAMLVLGVFMVLRGMQGWMVGVAFTGALLPFLFVATGWIAHYRNSVGKLRRMPSPTARIAFQDDGLGVVSELGSGHIAWAALTEIWERPGYWMLFMGPNQFNVLPLQGIDAADLEWLRGKVRTPGR
ncbi:YcxB family protein [Bordetella genomosp. 13]|uniref:YcxB family protein n=1 Tax=Bordetella genomosp. 13 TaxID=463040 RepID=UPI0011A139F0|nr:YcxB family protein [Bordetella genomosp. 13]